MILIFSEVRDTSTDKVVSWLKRYKVNFFRLNREDEVDVQLEIIEGSITVYMFTSNKIINLENISSVWYRRGDFSFGKFTLLNDEKILKDYVNSELNTFKEFLFSFFMEKRSIGNYQYKDINKLKCLYEALKVGFTVPETLICTKPDSLSIFEEKLNCSLINKAIQTSILINKDNISYSSTTNIIKSNSYIKNNESFFPSLFQRNIHKNYELRTFFFKRNHYTVAIFSQSSLQTKVDFRHLDIEKPIRVVPYNMPQRIVDKLFTLMEKLNLDTGSIDIIVDMNNDYIFLEVNPVGQFEFLEIYANHSIHKELADYLAEDGSAKALK